MPYPASAYSVADVHFGSTSGFIPLTLDIVPLLLKPLEGNVGANVGAKLETKEENSHVSRIQFTICVPSEPMSRIDQLNEATRFH